MPVKKEIMVTNKTGLHARPASLVVEKAKEYESEIKIINANKEANAKSIMGIMSLGIDQSTQITIWAEGPDANKAVADLIGLVEAGFGE